MVKKQRALCWQDGQNVGGCVIKNDIVCMRVLTSLMSLASAYDIKPDSILKSVKLARIK